MQTSTVIHLKKVHIHQQSVLHPKSLNSNADESNDTFNEIYRREQGKTIMTGTCP
jgi:hypothetical protein